MVLLTLGFRITRFPITRAAVPLQTCSLINQLRFHSLVSKGSCDLFGKCTGGSKIQFVLSTKRLSQHPGMSQGHGDRAQGAQGAKAVLPHSKRGQEILADVVNLPVCRSSPKTTAWPGGAPLAEWESLHPAL